MDVGRMGTALAAVAVLVATAVAGPMTARADRHGDGHDWFGEAQHLSGQLSGKQFVAGGEVFVDATVDGDLFAAGGDVALRGARAEDLFAAGGFLSLYDVTAADAILAGGQVDASGRFDGDLIAAGGSVEVGPAAEVAGDALLAGGRVEIVGNVQGELRAAAAHIRISGKVGGPASLAAERIVLGPGARIAGDVIYRAGEEIEIVEGAQVQGEITRRPMPGMGLELPGPLGLIFAAAFSWLGALIGMIALAAVLLAAFPRLLAGAADNIALRPWPTLLVGVGLLIAVPIAAAIVMATLIGLPLGLVGLLLYGAALAAGAVAVSLAIGRRLPWLGARHAAHVGYGLRLGRAAIGLLLLAVVGLLPFVGGLILFVATALGLGALCQRAWTMVGGEA